MSIFREYDIRGVVGVDLTEAIAEQIGYAFGTRLKEKRARTISVGRDGRLSSPALFDSFTRGICSAGIEVLDVGVCPTPLLYFSLFHPPGAEPVDGGAMITGSHNPAEYNGFKLCIGHESIYGEQLQVLGRMVQEAPSRPLPSPKKAVRRQEIIPLYHDYLVKQFSGLSGRGVKVVLDSGNATAGPVAPAIFRALGCEVVELYSEPDGRFPHHHPDPTVADNLSHLIKTVRAEKARFGVGYDGDADRIGVVDEKGSILWGDQLTMLFARDIIDQWKKTKKPLDTRAPVFVSEVKASQLLFDDIRKRGGRAVMWRTGHSLMKAKMKEEGAALAGEMSGHIFFADRYFGYDDAIYASIRLLELVIRQGKPLSSLLLDLPKTHSTPEIRVDCPDDQKFILVERLKEILQSELRDPNSAIKINELITVDGVRAVFDQGWGLVRASNTQPVLVLRFEAETPTRLSEIRIFIEGQLEKLKVKGNEK
jgi:phosphomannomutase / phosphoglucomutase